MLRLNDVIPVLDWQLVMYPSANVNVPSNPLPSLVYLYASMIAYVSDENIRLLKLKKKIEKK